MIKKKGLKFYVICPDTKSLKGVYGSRKEAEKADEDLKSDGGVETSKARKDAIKKAASVGTRG